MKTFTLNSKFKLLAIAQCLLALLLMTAVNQQAYGETVNLKANFRLYGEVSRFGLGYGDMHLRFGINVPPAGLAPEIGSLGYQVGGVPFTTGVLSGINLINSGFNVIDTNFSIPFSLEVDKDSSLYMGLGDNGINGWESGDIQVIFDFSDNMYFGGSILQFTPDQGFALTSVTLEDGTPLESAGLRFEFIPQNTILTAGASDFDASGASPTLATAIPDGFPSNTRAAVFLSKATATSKILGGFDIGGATTTALIDLDVCPEPDPFVFDLAFATVSGSNNVRLTRSAPPPPTNTPPVADAGSNVEIASTQQCGTVIHGIVTDTDNDPLQYSWLENQTELLGLTPVSSNGTADLNLCPLWLSSGQHTLTLKASDGKSTSTDTMILTIGNSAPTVSPTGEGKYSIGVPIMVGGQVSDFDGDLLTYTWSENGVTYCNGPSQLQSVKGGTPVNLPACQLPNLEFGTHVILLKASDGINQPVSNNITVTVADNSAPSLTPKANTTILWPPDHKMAKIIIKANAVDEGGGSVKLSATVSSNEPQNDLDDSECYDDKHHRHDQKGDDRNSDNHHDKNYSHDQKDEDMDSDSHHDKSYSRAPKGEDKDSDCHHSKKNHNHNGKDRDLYPDWTTPVINQATGVITLQLRRERSDWGTGRTYVVTITAVDETGNTSVANVEIVVPHDLRGTK